MRVTWQADIVFWLGDLNYRIKETLPDEAVFDMVARDDLETLRFVNQNIEGRVCCYW